MRIDSHVKPTNLANVCPCCGEQITIILSPTWEIGEKLAYTGHIMGKKDFLGNQKEGLLTELYGPKYYEVTVQKGSADVAI